MWKILLLVALIGSVSAYSTIYDVFGITQTSGTTVNWSTGTASGGWTPTGIPRTLSGNAYLNTINNATYTGVWSVGVSGNQQAKIRYSGYMDLTNSWIFIPYFIMDTTPDQSSWVTMKIYDIYANSHQVGQSLFGKPTGSIEQIYFYETQFQSYVNLAAVVEVEFTISSYAYMNMRLLKIESS